MEKKQPDADCETAADAGPPRAHAGGDEHALRLEKDRGVRGYLVMMVSFLCNGIIFGIINCYGVLYVSLYKQLTESEVHNAAFKCSLVGSLCTGLTFLVSAVSGVLADHVGLRNTAFCGATVAFVGLLISAFVTEHVEALLVTYGLLFGTGASLVYTPSLVVLGHYFEKKLGLVNGICAMGSSVFTFIMPFVMKKLLASVALSGTLLVLAAMVACLMPMVLVFRARHALPANLRPADNWTVRSLLGQVINVHIWRNKRYLVWSIAIPLGLFGYFVPYVHLIKHVELVFPAEDGTWLMPCLGLTSGLGRLLFGRIADLPRVNKIFLQQMSFVVIGLLTIMLAFCRSWPLLIATVLGMGLFDGCFISLLGPIAFQLVGPSGASQAIGFLLTLCSMPLTIGPPVAGVLYDQWQSYRTAFILAGCPPICAALLMCAIHRIPPEPADGELDKAAEAAATAAQHAEPLHPQHHLAPQCEELLGASCHAVHDIS